MSLTGQLRDTKSAISLWMERHISRDGSALLSREINDRLAHVTPLRGRGTPTIVGRAFDYGVRWTVGPLEARVAWSGARSSRTDYGWMLAEEALQAIITIGNTTNDLYIHARCCVALSWFEGVGRGDPLAPELEMAMVEPTASGAQCLLLQLVADTDVDDVARLLATVPDIWGNELRNATLNPTFIGSVLVGGADADWIVDGTLWECKTLSRSRPMERKHLLQLLGYALLDFDNNYQLQALGWYFARHRQRVRYPFDQLLYRLLDEEVTLSELRDDLRDTLQRSARVILHSLAEVVAGELRIALLAALPTFAETEARGTARITVRTTIRVTQLVAPEGIFAPVYSQCVLAGVVVGTFWTVVVAVIDHGSMHIRWSKPRTTQLDAQGRLLVASLPVLHPPGDWFWDRYAESVQELLKHQLADC